MRKDMLEYRVLVRNRPVTEYPHQSASGTQVWIEGRDGSEYAIEVRNQGNRRVEVLVTVDGLSTIDGLAAHEVISRGWIIPPFDRVILDGFFRGGDRGAAFTFSSPEDSYAALTGHGTSNVGVIGFAAYSDLMLQVAPPPLRPQQQQQFVRNDGRRGGIRGRRSMGMNMDDMPRASSSSAEPSLRSTSRGARAASLGASSSYNAATGGVIGSYNAVTGAPLGIAPEADGVLGTEFGRDIAMPVTVVEFQRGTMLHVTSIRYAGIRELERRGVYTARRARHGEPDPFPASGMGCVPPPGWRGR